MGRALIMVILRVLVRAYRADNIVFSVEGPVPIAVVQTDTFGSSRAEIEIYRFANLAAMFTAPASCARL